MGSPWVAGGGEYPKDPAEVGKYQSRDVGEKTGPSAPHTSHLFDIQFRGYNGDPLYYRCMRLPF